jgi:hypothetical protein
MPSGKGLAIPPCRGTIRCALLAREIKLPRGFIQREIRLHPLVKPGMGRRAFPPAEAKG